MEPRCDRCKKKLRTWRMSYFNTDIICIDCIKLERAHPQFKQAVSAEEAEVQRGNYNFDGIGLPPDLRALYQNHVPGSGT